MNVRYTLSILSAAAPLFASPAMAQDDSSDASAGVSLSASDEDGVDADAARDDADAEEASAGDEAAPGTAKASAAPTGKLPYMQRYRPAKNVLELGFFGGLLMLSPGQNLRSDGVPQTSPVGAAPELGGRLGYYPLTWLGIEAEAATASVHYQNDLSSIGLTANKGTVSAYRAQLVGQLPIWSIAPFVVAGVGALSGSSQAQGRQTDFAFHFGAGVKLPLCEDFALRAEFRESLHNRAFASFGGIAFSEEVQLGAAFTWGKPRSAMPPAREEVADQDGDHVPDATDACPTVPALTADGCPADTDSDGVDDLHDVCPAEAGEMENGCPNLDKDDDGVFLPADQCPEEKGEAPSGCVNRDPDGDGILEPDDKCPKEVETKNGYEDQDGCPDELPKEVEQFNGTMQGIMFFRGKATIQKSSERALHAAADVLKKYPNIRVRVTGHTSSDGGDEVNQKLSEERAASVRDWLVRAGVNDSSIEARGAGSSDPVADNATAAGREKNRRIDFEILH